MSQEPSNQPAPADSSLQFDKAEFTRPAALSCAVCQAPIAGQFYQANGQTICPACRDKIQTDGVGGSGLSRSLRALLAGLAAGFAGFLIYWLVSLSGFELGLIAIVVGWLVGTAVRWGSNARGGFYYQLMALVITYVAICAHYIPTIMSHGKHVATAPFLVRLVVSGLFSLAIPWLEGPSNIIGWIIIAIGLYQAWVTNRKIPIQVTGPFNASEMAAPQ